jgi:hypothetical protein
MKSMATVSAAEGIRENLDNQERSQATISLRGHGQVQQRPGGVGLRRRQRHET